MSLVHVVTIADRSAPPIRSLPDEVLAATLQAAAETLSSAAAETALRYRLPAQVVAARAAQQRTAPEPPACYRITLLGDHPRTAGRVEQVGHPEIGVLVCERPAHQQDAARWISDLTGGDARFEPFPPRAPTG